ncbi:MAG TPA: DinB family protein [Saprospiraceae bacterium]|nr:DinB family protein [Saprospiraceae bacterium]
MNEIKTSFKSAAVMRLTESHERISKCINLLNEDQLVFRPNNVSNSVANIIIHTLGNMTQYILSSLGNQADMRDRDREFVPRSSINKHELIEKVDQVFEKVLQTINDCTGEELLRKRKVQGFYFDGVGIIMHVVEHASYHVGQITYLTKMLTNSETNYYANLDLNVHNEE